MSVAEESRGEDRMSEERVRGREECSIRGEEELEGEEKTLSNAE